MDGVVFAHSQVTTQCHNPRSVLHLFSTTCVGIGYPISRTGPRHVRYPMASVLTNPRGLRSQVVASLRVLLKPSPSSFRTSRRTCLPSTSRAVPRLRDALARVVLKSLRMIFIYGVRRIVALHMEYPLSLMLKSKNSG